MHAAGQTLTAKAAEGCEQEGSSRTWLSRVRTLTVPAFFSSSPTTCGGTHCTSATSPSGQQPPGVGANHYWSGSATSRLLQGHRFDTNECSRPPKHDIRKEGA